MTFTLIGRRLARLDGRPSLSLGQLQRLCVLAALHDFGKYSVGFQNKRSPSARGPRCGHLAEALGLLSNGYAFAQQAWEALDLDHIAAWGEGDAMHGLLRATVSHHGRPVQPELDMRPEWWCPTAELDPFSGIAHLVAATKQWFPAAWNSGDLLPKAPAFQHAWAGILNLADWIGSDSDRFFPFSEEAIADRMPFARKAASRAIETLGLETARIRAGLMPQYSSYRMLLSPGATPRPAQRRILDVEPCTEGSVVILEAPTGSGKTEAAVMHFLRLFERDLVDGMYFALPLRAAAVQIHGRIVEAMRRSFDEASRPPVVLAVPGYRRVDDTEGVALPEFRTYWPDDDDLVLRYRGWAAENPKRFLAGVVVVGTIDQVLLSSLSVSHAHLRASALSRHVLVVDEVHASDEYMTRILEDVIGRHTAAGGHALLMSATLGTSARSRLLSRAGGAGLTEPRTPIEAAAASPYPLISIGTAKGTTQLSIEDEAPPKQVQFDLVQAIDDTQRIARLALDAARQGACVIVLRNTVKGCQAVQLMGEELARGEDESLLFRCRGVPAPHHSRFSATDRRGLDEELDASFGRRRPNGRGLIVVATQTVEQSLDLDADFLITDLCPMDVLLQRIGRVHRHERERPKGFQCAKVTVLVPSVADLSQYISKSGKPMGPHGLGAVYRDLRILERTWRQIRTEPVVELPRANRRLVERTTHPDALHAIVEELSGSWWTHERWLLGNATAERGVARLGIIAWDQPFDQSTFPDDRRIPTRLGEQDRLVGFAPEVVGPFGAPLGEMRIPRHLLNDPAVEDLRPTHVASDGRGAVEFHCDNTHFVYDRLGLRLQGSTK